MRIGIYNRWLPTLGGGERYTLDFARVFAAAGHEVELLTHQPLDLARVGRRLALPLDRIAGRRVPDSPANARLSAVSADYDLLLNVSQGDLFPSFAQRSALVIHFPAPLAAYSSGGVPDPPAPRFAGSEVRWLSGVYAPETDGTRSWVWTGRTARIELRRRGLLGARFLILSAMPLRPPTVPPPAVQVRIGGEVVAERADEWSEWLVRLPRAVWLDETVVVELEAAPWTLRDAGLAEDDRERGVALSGARLVGMGLETRLPTAPWQRLRITEHSVAEAAHALDSYGLVLANSRFTQEWIARRWERASSVLYPAVDLQPLVSDPAGKRQEMVSVGRFFAGAHNKQHLPMIAAFKALCDAGLRGWTYHLVGGCDVDQPEQRAYLERIQAAAAGYPIQLHVNAPLDELRRRYAAASLFWHAAGYGVDVAAEPEAVEHFGITTIEAMAAGCVPVVIARGGQVEIVEAGRSGLLWETLDELQSQTTRLIADVELRHSLAGGAVARSAAFSFDRFAAEVAATFGLGS